MNPTRPIHHSIFTWSIAVLCLTMSGYSATATGEATTAEIKQETIDLLEALEAYSVDQRDKAIAKSKSALENLDQRIESLEEEMLEEWDDMDAAARKQTQESLKALRQQRTRVAEWYGRMKSSSANAWEQMKQGFSSAYEELNEAWENSEKEFDHSKEK